MTHAEMNELYELYALGALEFDDAVEIDKHVADNCDYCIAQIQQAVRVTAMLSGMQDSVEPPAHVRGRVLAAISPGKPAKSVRRWNWYMPAFAAACVALLGVAIWSWVTISQSQGQLRRMSQERAQLREALQVLSSSQPTLVQFGNAPQQPRGTVFFNRNGGFVMLGSRLPQIAHNKTFELWVIPKQGAPIPAGVFQGQGDAHTFVHTYQEPLDVRSVAALAVTVEPERGSLAPSTKPFLVVPIGT
jgi:anti-sigma-K factor RskA